LEPTARRMAPVSLPEKRYARAHQSATARPLQALRTVADARSIPAAANIHNHSAQPDPARVAPALSFGRRVPPQNRTEPALYRPEPHNNKAHSGESIRAPNRVRRAPTPPRLAQSECAPELSRLSSWVIRHSGWRER